MAPSFAAAGVVCAMGVVCRPFTCMLCEGKPTSPGGHSSSLLSPPPDSRCVPCAPLLCSVAHASASSLDLCAAAEGPPEDIETASCGASSHACPPLHNAYREGSLVAHLRRGRIGLSSVGVAGFGEEVSWASRTRQIAGLPALELDLRLGLVEMAPKPWNFPSKNAFTIAQRKKTVEPLVSTVSNAMDASDVATARYAVPAAITTFPSSAQIVSEPLGVVLVISTWNYPFLLSIDPVIGAIAAGNVVVLKPSEIAPATSSLFAKLLPEYVDNSCIKVVEGGIPETTALLEQKWDKIFYTGNGNVGRIVMAAAAKHLTPVALELGGKCPVIVDSNVDLHVAIKRIAVGKWGCNNGQACIAPDYIITTRSFAPELVDSLKIVLERFYGKDPLRSADLSRIVNSNHFHRLTNLIEDKKVSDKIVYGGQIDEKQLKIAPTVLVDVPLDSALMTEEIFGPFLPIITVDKIEESIGFLNSRTKPLAAYLFTKNKKLQDEFVASVSAGGMLVNDAVLHLTNPHLPFGGVGDSGMGSYHGKFSFDCFSHKKAVLIRGFGGEVNARYPPYTPEMQKILRGLIDGSFIALIVSLLGFPRERR